MPRILLIDDVELAEEDDEGPPVMFTNHDIRRMLTLAKAGPKDIFCDHITKKALLLGEIK